MYKAIKKARFLRIISFLFLVIAISLKVVQGESDSGMLIFFGFAGVMVYAIISALSLFPPDWKRRAFEPAKEENMNRKEIEILEDEIQLKIAFGWVNVIIMLIISLGIYFGC